MDVKRVVLASALAAAQVCVAASVVSAGERDWSEIYLADSPQLSPDGGFVVFAWCGRIWRAPTAGGTAVALDDGKSVCSSPRISPDGRRVAFLSDRTGTTQLFELQLGEDGLSAHSLRQVTFHTQSLTPCGYSPDGAYMIATGFRDHASESVTNMRSSRRAFFVPMGARAAEELLFDAPAREPALSPDGRRVLFVAHGLGDGNPYRKHSKASLTSNVGHIWLFDRDSGEFRPVVTERGGADNPAWAPDGRAFYYISGAEGVRNIRRREVESGEERVLTDFRDDNVCDISVSRDGRTMVFSKGFDLWRMDLAAESPVAERIAMRPSELNTLAGRSVRRKYSTLDNNYGAGNCSFAVASNATDVAFTAGGDLWVMSMDDETREPVLVHGATRTHERDCFFAPDGSALYYLSDRGEGADVWRAERADKNAPWSSQTEFVRTRLTDDDVCRRELSVSPDGRLLAWTDMTGRLSFADTNAVVVHRSSVPSCDEDVGHAWSPDGRYMAVSQMDGYGNRDVWVIPSFATDDEGNPAPEPCNVSRNHKWDGFAAWSPDGRLLVFSGERSVNGGRKRIFYAYLDPEDEAHEAAGKGIRKEPCRVDLKGLPDRVRATSASGIWTCFSPDPRVIAFTSGGKTFKTRVGAQKPKDAKENPKEMFGGRTCLVKSWVKAAGGEKLLTTIDNVPAVGDKKRNFTVYQRTDVADYQELAFMIAWAAMRDDFSNPGLYGADWAAVREKYRLAARNAPSWGTFARVVRMMLGELDASHTGFWAGSCTKERWLKSVSEHGWSEVTAHVGARFDPKWAGEGWRVKDVIPESPADCGEEGLLAGDVVLSVDGKAVRPGMDYSEAMNTALPHKFRLVVRREGVEKELVRELDAITFQAARRLLRAAEVAAARRYVRSRGNFGYIAVDAMNDSVADEFTDAVFAECFGKDGVVIDVRYNSGGHTTDRLLDMLCGNRHCRTLFRGDGNEGYLLVRYKRPVITTLPVVAIANERSQSCAEEFSHAMQTLGRAKVVGVETAGAVIGTPDMSVLDYGVMKLPHVGFFLMDGTDMEWHGAKPDVEVYVTPADIAAGRDPQLEAALEVLANEAEERKANPPPPLRFSR